ncbi:hypothetical protein ALC56_06513 [Trachymyrmex septentrionalis]|uniref:Uncharacterized protein n=1 Tax=Trachymyrmex septentrionalis TaxID=34720 RepID=A0A195FFT3_9HYME|nr:hypothetical protein ALC56_06513 [Trachymyrmex septentrionalis]
MQLILDAYIETRCQQDIPYFLMRWIFYTLILGQLSSICQASLVEYVNEKAISLLIYCYYFTFHAHCFSSKDSRQATLNVTNHVPTFNEIVNCLLPRDDQASSAPLKAAQNIT